MRRNDVNRLIFFLFIFQFHNDYIVAMQIIKSTLKINQNNFSVESNKKIV